MVKNPPAMWETWVQSLGWRDPLEEGMAAHSSVLAWRIPWTEEPGGLQSIGHKELDTTEVSYLPHRGNSDVNDCRFLWKLWRSEIVNDIFKVSKELSTQFYS